VTALENEATPVADQSRIWDHFQNEGVKSFSKSRPRLSYILGRIRAGSKMLNIGVGGAFLEGLAVEKGVDVYILDPNERSISKVRDLHNLGDKAQTGYSDNIPFDADKFDNVVMSEVLEHLSTEVLEKTINEVARVLKPNGAFLITIPFEEDLADGLVVCPHCGDKFHRWGHQQTFSMDRLRQLLSAEGFHVEKMQARCFPDWSRKGLTNKVKSGIRHVLGRLKVNIAQPSIFVAAINRSATHLQ